MTNATKAKQGKRPAKPTPRGGGRSSSTWIAISAVIAIVVLAAMFFSGGGDADDGGFAPSAPGTVSIEREGGPMLAAGEDVPEFEAPALEGGGTIAWRDVEGAPTVLSIWAPWCPHCQAELPRLSAGVDARPGLQLVTVTTAYGAQPGPTPPEYLADEGLSFPVAVDDDAQTLLRGFGVESFPTTYYVASDGTVVTATTGEVPADQLDAILDDLATR
jgi:thiol-disulfide isomerase/thioredoxin